MTACTSDTPGCLLKEPNLDRARYLGLLDRAAELKASRAAGERPRRLVGRNIALIFEKSSTCTRCAFEVAAHDEGAEVTYLGPDGSHIRRDESIADTAQVLGRMYEESSSEASPRKPSNNWPTTPACRYGTVLPTGGTRHRPWPT